MRGCTGHPFDTKGGFVVARERPTASPGSALTGLDNGADAADLPRITRAEADALRRSAPGTHARLAEHLEPLRASNHRKLCSVGAGGIHTVFRSATGNWANQSASGEHVYGVYATNEECVRRGQRLASATGVDHVIHDVDGTVRSPVPATPPR